MKKASQNSYMICIGGGSGAGKTTVAQHLAKAFSNQVLLLSLDNYYRDRSHIPVANREQINYDHPRAFEWRLLRKHLEQLLVGESVKVPCYNFKTHTRSSFGRLIKSRKIIILEGILALYNKVVMDLVNLRIYVESEADVRILRRIKRDIEKRDRSIESNISQYLTTIKPMHEKFVEPTKCNADIIISGESNHAGIKLIELKIREHLNQGMSGGEE